MADTSRMTALQNLSNQLPVANSQLAAGQEAARKMKLQQAVAAAPVTGGIQPTAQQAGTATAAEAGTQAVQNAQKTVAQQGQIGQLGLAEQARQGRAEIGSAQLGAGQEKMDQVQQFANLDQSLKQKLYDDTMKFQKDELGRTVFNENQLADYYRTKVQNQEEFKNLAQKAQQASKRSLLMIQKAYELEQEDLKNQYEAAKQAGDQATMKQIKQSQFDNDQAMQRQKNRDANNAAVWTAGGTIAGGAVGAMAGQSAQGANVGAGVGGALGGLGSTMKF